MKSFISGKRIFDWFSKNGYEFAITSDTESQCIATKELGDCKVSIEVNNLHYNYHRYTATAKIVKGKDRIVDYTVDVTVVKLMVWLRSVNKTFLEMVGE